MKRALADDALFASLLGQDYAPWREKIVAKVLQRGPFLAASQGNHVAIELGAPLLIVPSQVR
jgi:hypothetical protein